MPYAFLFFIVVKLIVYFLKEDKETTEGDYFTGIEFLVNNRTIQIPHSHHYRELLGLVNDKALTDKVIKYAYCRVYDDVAELRVITPVVIDVAELRAAKFYLMDRWAYLAHKN